MSADQLWEIFRWLIFPLSLAYVGYLHREHTNLANKVDNLRSDQADHVAKVGREFVTKDDLYRFENRLMSQFDKIDTKLTSLYERK